jgi:hypothetical protein
VDVSHDEVRSFSDVRNVRAGEVRLVVVGFNGSGNGLEDFGSEVPVQSWVRKSRDSSLES